MVADVKVVGLPRDRQEKKKEIALSRYVHLVHIIFRYLLCPLWKLTDWLVLISTHAHAAQ